MVEIKIKLLSSKVSVPKYQTPQSAGMDLEACLDAPISINPHERCVIPTGIALSIPDGYEAQIRGRSGLAVKYGIMPANGVGTIDSDYRGEIGVILLNTSNEIFVVEPNMRIAQVVFNRYEKVNLIEVAELDATERNEGGYGSTGS